MSRRKTFLPFALPQLGDAELEEVKSVLESGWITTGPKTQQFEAEFAEYVGAKHAVAVNSCTAAMHLSLEATGVQPGDFVLTTPYTFAATAEVVRYFDAIPVFVDVERDTLNMHPQALVQTFDDLASSLGGARPSMPAVARAMAKVTDARSLRLRSGRARRRPVSGPGRIQAVIPVHMAGHPCEVEALATFARTHQLAIIEDAAHACSASYKGTPIGSAAPGVRGTTCFSFYATKTLATGEGGMMTTDADDCAERVRMMSLHGISKDAWKRYTASGSWYYEIIEPGFKYNMSDLAAAIGLAQLRKVDAMRQRRAEIAARYSEAFVHYDELEVPTVRPHVGHAWHLYTLRLNAGLSISRDEFIEYLKNAHIGTSVHFIPLHIHPYYEAAFGYRPEDLPVAFQEYQREISLPIYSKMSDPDVRSVIDAVSNVVEQFRATRRYAVAGH